MEELNTLFDNKLKEALDLIVGVQKMVEEVNKFELEENRHRSQMPPIFSVGTFKASSTGLVFESKEFFISILETIKIWSDKASVKIRDHNAELELIQEDVLITVKQMIERAIKDRDKEHVEAVSKLQAQFEDQRE